MAIALTETAAGRVEDMIAAQAISDGVVRLGVTAGGCSGYEYVLDIVSGVRETDRVFENHGVRVVCDPRSYLYVNGTIIDFDDAMMGGGFKFENPNATRSCGCGTSFQA